jgi:hypothetical protein
MAALEPELQGEDRVREVFRRVRNGDDRVADLYAEDGVVLVGGARVEGREAIRAFYRRTIDTIHPQPEVEAVLGGPPYYAAIVEVPTGRGHMHALDLFQLGDDGIRQLEIYSRHDDDGSVTKPANER